MLRAKRGERRDAGELARRHVSVHGAGDITRTSGGSELVAMVEILRPQAFVNLRAVARKNLRGRAVGNLRAGTSLNSGGKCEPGTFGTVSKRRRGSFFSRLEGNPKYDKTEA